MRLMPFSYFWICWKVRPSFSPSFSWLMPSSMRRKRTRLPTWMSIGIWPPRALLVALCIVDETGWSRHDSPVRVATRRTIGRCRRVARQPPGPRSLTYPIADPLRIGRSSVAPAPHTLPERRAPPISHSSEENRNRRSAHRAAAARRPAAPRRSRRARRDRAAPASARSASMTAEMPLLAARMSGSPSSTARTRAWCRCWRGPVVLPNQPSLVTLSMQRRALGALHDGARERSPRSRSAAPRRAGPARAAAAAASRRRRSRRAGASAARSPIASSSRCNGRYSPNGTRWILS